MKKLALTLALSAFAVALTACGSSNPGKPSPTVLGTQQPAPQGTEAPEMPHY